MACLTLSKEHKLPKDSWILVNCTEPCMEKRCGKKWQLGKILHFRYKSVKLKLQRILLRILRSVCERCYDIR